jgi:hypothetical protein
MLKFDTHFYCNSATAVPSDAQEAVPRHSEEPTAANSPPTAALSLETASERATSTPPSITPPTAHVSTVEETAQPTNHDQDMAQEVPSEDGVNAELSEYQHAFLYCSIANACPPSQG